MTYRYTENDVRSTLIGLCRAAGVPVAGGVGSYSLRAVDSTGSLGLFEEINEQGGVRRLAAGYTAKTKREACMMIAAYREGMLDKCDECGEKHDDDLIEVARA